MKNQIKSSTLDTLNQTWSQLSENEKEDTVIQAMKLITELKKANEFWKAEKIELRKIKKH